MTWKKSLSSLQWLAVRIRNQFTAELDIAELIERDRIAGVPGAYRSDAIWPSDPPPQPPDAGPVSNGSLNWPEVRAMMAVSSGSIDNSAILERARELLVRTIGEDAAAAVENGGVYPITSSIDDRYQFNVSREKVTLYERHNILGAKERSLTWVLCIAPEDTTLPWADKVYTIITMIRADERAFVRIANFRSVTTPDEPASPNMSFRDEAQAREFNNLAAVQAEQEARRIAQAEAFNRGIMRQMREEVGVPPSALHPPNPSTAATELAQQEVERLTREEREVRTARAAVEELMGTPPSLPQHISATATEAERGRTAQETRAEIQRTIESMMRTPRIRSG